MHFLIKFIGTYLNMLAYIFPSHAGKRGFELFCTPFNQRLKKHEFTFLEPAIQPPVEYEGKKIQLYKWGSGSRHILLLHGWKSNSFRWRPLIQSFEGNDVTIYAFDAPAHGLSQGKMLNLILYKNVLTQVLKNLPKMDLAVGHSFGALAIIYALFENPKVAIHKAVIMGAPGEVTDFFDYFKAYLSLNTKAIAAIEKYFIHTIGFSPAYFSSKKMSAQIKLPALIIHDTNDVEAPYHHAENLHRVWENSRLFTTNGLGHKLKSQEVYKEIVDFL